MEINLLTIGEVANTLRMHPNTIRRYVKNKQIIATKIGKSWLVTKEGVENFIKKCQSVDINKVV